jgi:hypothetical protein
MERELLAKRLKNFETSGWQNKASRIIEGTICQLQVIRSAKALSSNKLELILKTESKLLEQLRFGNPDSFIHFLPFIRARQIVSEFL